jgi:hypothetical protein
VTRRNLPASVRQRLTDRARADGEDLMLVLTRYAIERLLYRLSQTPHADRFVLKGAILFNLWTDQPHRPTRDVDLLGTGSDSIEDMADVFRDVCRQPVEADGLDFDPASVRADRIKEDQDYRGVRVLCTVRLGQARIPLQIDVGFGDAVTPRATRVHYPTLLEFPGPVLAAYPRETVVAEKFQAMVALGIANSRMKDFFDVRVLAQRFAFDGPSLARAISATFRRRKTTVPAQPPLALTSEFGTDGSKTKQWDAFVRKGKLDTGGIGLADVCDELNRFLMPPARAVAAEQPYTRRWEPGGPWAE